MTTPLVIVSNRLPVTIFQNEETEEWNIKASSGGLVTALRPVISQVPGWWIGWSGVADDEDAPVEELVRRISREMGCRFLPVTLSEELVEGYYYGFANEALWPLFHDLLGHTNIDFEAWHSYRVSNRKFADRVEDVAAPNEVIWIHDYQLILMGEELRRKKLDNPLIFFLHIPFPSPDIYKRLPWRKELLKALLSYDLVGFQVERDLHNFADCVREMLPDVGVEYIGNHVRFIRNDYNTLAGAYPISIDFDEFSEMAHSSEVEKAAWIFKENFPRQQLIVGIDRLDYTKGIPSRLMAFERALEKYPDLRGQVSFVQLVVPSRTYIPEYKAWKEKLDQIVGRINGRFGLGGWVPVHYMYRSLEREELIGIYRASEVALITPIKDGMNLVAKEYCASCVGDNGVLILSEFAGAATQLGDGSLIVNPYDREGVADAIHEAFLMPEEERKRRMKKLRRVVRETNIHVWVRRFLEDLETHVGFHIDYEMPESADPENMTEQTIPEAPSSGSR